MSYTGTAVADIINPEVLADQVSAKFPTHLVFSGSGLVDVDTTFPLGSPGTMFKIPFWKRIPAFAALAEATAMTTGKITAASENAVVLRGGGAYEVSDWSALVSKADPVGEIASQIARRAAEYVDAQVVAEADKTPNAYDYSGISAGTMCATAVVNGLINTLGDNYGGMVQGGVMIMHSKVYGDLLKLDAITNQYQSGMNVLQSGMIPTFMGLPILLSDNVTITASSTTNFYNTYIVAPGALALFYQRNVRVEFDRDILKQTDILAATVHFAPHLYGWDDYGNAVAAEAETDGKYKSIKCVKIKTK